jgi:tetratricopeptide (TPR) repeat protein
VLSAEVATPSNAWALMWLRIALGGALTIILGPSERAHSVLVEALGMAEALDDVDAQARALSALVSVYTYRGEYRDARAAGERLQRIAHRIGAPLIVVVADRVLGTTLLTAGMLREAQQCLERVLQSPVTPDDHRHSNWRHSEHRAMARAMLARTLWLQGFAEKAKAEAFASLDELQGSDHQLSLCRVIYYGLGRITPMIGDFETAQRAIERLATVAATLKAPFWTTAGRFLEGKLLIARGAFATGFAVLSDAFETCRRTGWSMSYPEFRGACASGLAGLGQLGEALEAVNDGIANAGQREGGQQWYVPELLRIKGEVLLQQDPERFALESEDCLDQASEMARGQGALFWELRVALSLARLRIIQARHDEGRRLLALIYDKFVEGLETPDLRAARAILESRQVQP